MTLILFITAGPAMFVNPVSVGLGPIFKKDLAKVIKEEDQKDDQGRWAVYGNRLLPNFFIASGANVLDGVKYTPMFDDLKVLDPEKKYNLVYNRYAHTMMNPNAKEEDSDFRLLYPDLYEIRINPCSSKLRQLKITHLAFDVKPDNEVKNCASQIGDGPINNTWLYKYK